MFCATGCYILMRAALSGAVLHISPPFQHYNATTDFTSLICFNEFDDYLTSDEIEWLYPNFTLLTSTNFRIIGNKL